MFIYGRLLYINQTQAKDPENRDLESWRSSALGAVETRVEVSG